MTTLVSEEKFGWQAHAEVFKFSARDMADAGCHVGPSRWLGRQYLREPDAAEMFARGIPFETVDAGDNLLCTAGITRMLNLLIGAGGQALDNTHSRILVGDGTGSVPTPAAGDTDLAAVVNAANRYGQLSDATFPSVATNVVTFQSTFATGNANFVWNEWGIDAATASGATAATAPLLNHKGVNVGTKTSAAAWAFKVTITVT